MGQLSSHRTRASGFTLVEIVVVVVVIGIAAALVVANVGGDSVGDLNREARRLAGTLEHAQARAQWQAEMLGVSAEGRGYRFWSRNAADGWIALTGDEILVPYALPSGMTVALVTYADAPVAADAVLPFRASGRNEPFAMELASPAGRVAITGDPVGHVRFASIVDSTDRAAGSH